MNKVILIEWKTQFFLHLQYNTLIEHSGVTLGEPPTHEGTGQSRDLKNIKNKMYLIENINGLLLLHKEK